MNNNKEQSQWTWEKNHKYILTKFVSMYTKDAKFVHIDFAILVVCNATTKING
jgi:hypothetical protein